MLCILQIPLTNCISLLNEMPLFILKKELNVRTLSFLAIKNVRQNKEILKNAEIKI